MRALRRSRLVLAFSLLACAVAAGSSASAIELPFTGTISFRVFEWLPPLVVSGGGVANGSFDGDTLTRVDLPAGLITGRGIEIPVTDPGAFPIRGILGSFGNASGVLALGGAPAGGSLPLGGVVKVCLFGEGGCAGALSNLSVPVGVVGRDATTDVTGVVNLTVRGAPWTTGTIDVGPPGATHTAMGSAAPNALNLVTPIFISTNLTAIYTVLRSSARLELAFAPTGDHCQNGVDDDQDGATDFPDDSGCASAGDESERDDGAPCDDGRDDDGDLRIDAADPGCDGPDDPSERSAALVCDDGLDNDGDGEIDEQDGGCASPEDPSEAGSAACDDGLDDDGDGLVDLLDPGCSGPRDESERGPALVCDDGLDQDGDGLADRPDDPGCASIEDPSEKTATLVCDDGLDQDGDGRTDYSTTVNGDPGCASPTDPSEKSLAFACDDGLDNDFDGFTDVPGDPGCSLPSDASEQSFSLACDNGLDDDGDGAIDSQQDGGCSGPGDAREAVDLDDGGYWVFGPRQPVEDDLAVDLGLPDAATRLVLVPGSRVAGDVTLGGTSSTRFDEATIGGELVVQEAAELDLWSASLGGTLAVRDGAVVTIRGSGFDRPLGSVTATSGTLSGFLSDGSAFQWSFARDAGATLVLAPEPEAVLAACAAIAALAWRRRRVSGDEHR